MIKHFQLVTLTYPLSLNFSTSSIGLLPPISKICLKTKTWSILIVKKHSGLLFHFFWSHQLFAWAYSCWDVSQQVDCKFRLRDYYDIQYVIYTQIWVLISALCTYVNCGNFWMNCSMTSLIWSASSRVGVITRAPTCRRHQLNLHRGSKPRSSPPPRQKFIYKMYRRVSSSPASSSASLLSSAAVLWLEWQKRASFRFQLPAMMRHFVSWSRRSIRLFQGRYWFLEINETTIFTYFT